MKVEKKSRLSQAQIAENVAKQRREQLAAKLAKADNTNRITSWYANIVSRELAARKHLNEYLHPTGVVGSDADKRANRKLTDYLEAQKQLLAKIQASGIRSDKVVFKLNLRIAIAS